MAGHSVYNIGSSDKVEGSYRFRGAKKGPNRGFLIVSYAWAGCGVEVLLCILFIMVRGDTI